MNLIDACDCCGKEITDWSEAAAVVKRYIQGQEESFEAQPICRDCFYVPYEEPRR